MLRRLLAVAVATITIAVTTHAGLLWLALWTVTICATAIKPNSKVQANERRISQMVAAQGGVNVAQTNATNTVNGRVNGLSGASTGAPNSTGFFNTQGLASGSYGSTHQHTLPNFPTATHGHSLPSV